MCKTTNSETSLIYVKDTGKINRLKVLVGKDEKLMIYRD